MKAIIRWSILSLLILTTFQVYAQKVANYSHGVPGTDSYEEFSFWVKQNKRADISYTYGKDWKTINLTFISTDVLNGDNGFTVRFPNNYILYIIPKSEALMVSDLTGKYKKWFAWKYEGPVNGVGTFCEPCTEDENEAMNLIRSYYQKKK